MRRWLACLLAGLASAGVQAGAGLELYLADPPRPGILAGCELYFFAETATDPWRRIDRPVTLAWPDGEIVLNPGTAAGSAPASLREHCFRLVLDGRLLAGGAVVSPHSARYLTFPVLLADDGRDGLARLDLRPDWTMTVPLPSPGFLRVLDALNGHRSGY